MKFYDSIGLPNPDRVRIALAEKGVLDQVEIIQVNLWEGEHRTAAFKAINPSVTVPCSNSTMVLRFPRPLRSQNI
jgi:glutathione S-transferase